MRVESVCVAVLIVSVLVLPTPVAAEESPTASPYAVERERAVKALSREEIADLAAGRGMGMAKVAELNHYPGPKHVLGLKQQLGLESAQTREIERIHSAMEQEVRRLGADILAKESALEALFAKRPTDEASARTLFVELGQLRGELRFAHVKAHLATARVLSPAQIAAYDRLRGYGGASEHEHHH